MQANVVSSVTGRDLWVALKRHLPDMRKDLWEIEKFLSEAKLMATLEHVRIVKFVGVGWDSLADLCVVSEYMVGGTCADSCTGSKSKRSPRGFDRDKVIITLHVAHAITYLHSLDPIILHRDLKSKNILLDERMYAKVMDFGVSREQSDGRKVADTAIIQMVSSGKIRVQFSEPTNDEDAPLDLATAIEMERLCKSCVAFDARDRPTAAEVLYQLQKVLRAFDDAEEILAELRACV